MRIINAYVLKSCLPFFTTKNILFLIVTCDEKCILYNNCKCSALCLDANKALQNFSKPKLYQRKIMVTVWWSSTSLIHYSFIKPGKTIIAGKYCREIDEMHQKLTPKKPALLNKEGCIFLRDNARPHVSMITQQELHMFNYEVLDCPPYSPGLSPTDFHFFKHLNNFLPEKCFKNPKDAETAFNEFVASRMTTF